MCDCKKKIENLTIKKTCRIRNPGPKCNILKIDEPIGLSSEKIITQLIEEKWGLRQKFLYLLKCLPMTSDDICDYYNYEVIFSQPTPAYPIPPATVTVYFKVRIKHLDPTDEPLMTFRVEGRHIDNDVRNFRLTCDWLSMQIKSKTKLYKRIEGFSFF